MTEINIQKISNEIINEVSKAVIGKNEVIEDVLASFYASGHVLLEDNPGVAKTLLAKSLSTVLGLEFSRVQFTPDLLPNDITGGHIYNRKTNEFELNKGPVFSNILLADEINRASPKTQSALLEAMAEKQVTLEGVCQKLPDPFWVIATQNPLEHESTFNLPEAQLDRFALKLSIGYPTEALEIQLLMNRLQRKQDEVSLTQILNTQTVQQIKQQIEHVEVNESLVTYIIQLIQKTRNSSEIALGASPRAGLALLALARARAAIQGRSFVKPDDIKHFIYKVLLHRIVLKPELYLSKDEDIKQITHVIESINLPVLEGI
ncbi:AAA family ATPase [Marinicellulosiphila megalodicopiae]|uniref:AAA family ATPase n=1 Tax=Marinicellulosiphila megalodicopiae TaxID=2724896 RepID=UPI003BB13826